jgi:hypothetical protein
MRRGSTNIAQPIDFEHMEHGRQASGGGLGRYQLLDFRVTELSDCTATGANQELPRMPVGRIRAADEGVQ